MRARPTRTPWIWLALLGLLTTGGCAAYEMSERAPSAGGDDDDNSLGDDDDDGWGDDDDQSGDDCFISGTSPVDGDPTAYYRDPIRVFFAEPVEQVSLDVADAERAISVPGTTTLSPDGLLATFDPHDDDPLQHLLPMTDYHAAVIADGCEASWSFTTSVLGTPLHDDFALEGATYIVHLDQASLAEPEGLESLLERLPLDPFLMQVLDADDDQLRLIAAGLDLASLDQDPCRVPVELTDGASATLLGSHLTLPSVPLAIPVQQDAWYDDGELWTELLRLSFDAEFSPDGSTLSHGVVRGVVDGYQIDALLRAVTGQPDNYQPGSTCGLLAQLGHPCAECPGDPQQQTCFPFTLDGVEAYWQGSLELDLGANPYDC